MPLKPWQVTGGRMPSFGKALPGLTARQSTVLRLLADGEKRGRPCTLREIAAAIESGTSNSASTHLHALARKGVIEFLQACSSRNVRITPKGHNLLGRLTPRGRALREALKKFDSLLPSEFRAWLERETGGQS